jgi:hypothetical protein
MKCKHCKAPFVKQRAMQSTCSIPCALAFVAARKEKAAARFAAEERKLTAQARVRLKTRSELAQEAQTAVNAYVRLRDAGLPCVSCDRPPSWDGQWDAGHYRSRGARPDLRFDLENLHRQCLPCNRHLSGNLINYRVELVKRIGQAAVDRLEGPAKPDKLTRDELIELKARFRAMARELRARS